MESISAPIIDVCANCGKEEGGEITLKVCTACKLVKYCDRDCQAAHRPKHKKACKQRAAKLHDEALFKEHPPPEECPICMLPLPTRAIFQSCCGKRICDGCICSMMREIIGRGKIELKDQICPFCRMPPAGSAQKEVERVQALITKSDNVYAYNKLADYYSGGELGLPQDWAKANDLYCKSGELGCARAYHCLGRSYADGRGFEMDKKKAKYYWEIAAMNGDAQARIELGGIEFEQGNYDRAYKHYMIAARAGNEKALEGVKAGYMDGIVTKDEYAGTLRAHHDRQKEMKSDERDKAATFYNHPNFGQYPSSETLDKLAALAKNRRG